MMRATDGSDFPAQQQSNKEKAIAHTVHRMYAITDHLASQPSTKNCSREIKMKFVTSLRTIIMMRVEESFHNAGVKIRAAHAWKFFKNKLTKKTQNSPQDRRIAHDTLAMGPGRAR